MGLESVAAKAVACLKIAAPMPTSDETELTDRH
jgi:hypothetical protein